MKEDGELDREALAKIVFRDKELRGKLNKVMSFSIGLEIAKQILWHFFAGEKMVVIDAALLIESGLYKVVQSVVVVDVNPEVQMERLMKRNSLDEEEAKLKIASQLPAEKRRSFAHFIIDNNGDIQNTELQAKIILNKIACRPHLFTRNTLFIFLFLFVALIYFILRR